MLAEYLNQTLGLGWVDLHSMFTICPNFADEPERGMSAFLWDADIPLIAFSHGVVQAKLGQPTVLLIRDPRAVIVSAWHCWTKHWPGPGGYYKGTLSEFVRGRRVGIKPIIRDLNAWGPSLGKLMVIHYEDLHARPRGTLYRITQYLELPESARAVLKAVEASTFDRMLQLELAQGLPGHDYDRGDPMSRRMRVGSVDSWKDELRREDEEYVQSFVNDHAVLEVKALLARYSK